MYSRMNGGMNDNDGDYWGMTENVNECMNDDDVDEDGNGDNGDE